MFHETAHSVFVRERLLPCRVAVIPGDSNWKFFQVGYPVDTHTNIALTEVLATQMDVMRRSKKVRPFELYKFNPLSPHCGSIARELVHCYTWGRLRIVTVRGNTLGRHS